MVVLFVLNPKRCSSVVSRDRDFLSALIRLFVVLEVVVALTTAVLPGTYFYRTSYILF